MQKNNRPTVLIFIDWFTPGYKAGGPVRSMVNMTEQLADEIDFFVVTRNNEYGESAPYSFLEYNQWVEINSNINVLYTTPNNQNITNWKKVIDDINPNYIYINGIYSLKFSLFPLLVAKKQKKRKVIVSPRGMLAPSAINIKGYKKKLFLKINTFLNTYKNAFWHATNDIEAEQITDILKVDKDKITVAPNLPRKTENNFKTDEKVSGTLNICSFARIAPEKNTLYAIKSLNSVNKKQSVTLDLYGDIYNQDYWTECKNEFDLLPKNITVNYKGTVHPDEVFQKISDYHLLYLPSQGENFGHIILETFMAGRPVLISDRTPWRNLTELQIGWDISLDKIEKFGKVIDILAEMNQEEFDNICKNAFVYGEKLSKDEELLIIYQKLFS